MVTTVIAEMGGVGKTSIIFNLAWYMAEQGKKILLIDLDPQKANLSYLCGIKDVDNKLGIFDILKNSSSIEETICEVKENLSIIPANENAKYLPTIIEHLSGAEKVNVLKNIIKPVKNKYDYIFFDTNPTPSIIHVVTLVASDNLIIPLLPDGKSLEGTKSTVDTYEAVKKAYNKKLEILALVYNQKDRRKRFLTASQSAINMFCDLKDIRVAKTQIASNAPIAETFTFKQGITETDRRSIGAKNFISLSEELFGI